MGPEYHHDDGHWCNVYLSLHFKPKLCGKEASTVGPGGKTSYQDPYDSRRDIHATPRFYQSRARLTSHRRCNRCMSVSLRFLLSLTLSLWSKNNWDTQFRDMKCSISLFLIFAKESTFRFSQCKIAPTWHHSFIRIFGRNFFGNINISSAWLQPS